MNKVRKIFVSLLLTASMLCSVNIASFAAESEKDIADDAYAIFGQQTKTSNMIVKYGATNEYMNKNTVVEKEGRAGWNITPEGEWLVKAIYINVKDSYVSNLSDYSSYELEVDYFDEGTGWFFIQYDAICEPWGDGRYTQKRLEDINLTDTKTWKTAKIKLEYPKFKNNLSGSDIIISVCDQSIDYSPAPVVIGAARLNKTDAHANILINASTDHIGNNFFSDEPVSIQMDFYNVTKQKQKANIKITSYDMDENIEYEDAFDIELDAGQSETKQYEYTPEKKSVYKMYVEAIGENTYSSCIINYSYCMKADKLNPFCGVNNHTYTYDTRLPEVIIPLMENAGYSMTRESIWWYEYEKKKGEYAMTPMLTQRKALWDKSEIEQQLVLQKENSLYIDGWARGDIPVAACVEYAKHFVEENKGKIKYYEIFNEVQSELYAGCDAAWYADILKKMYPALKAIDPDITIIAGVTSEIPIAWISEVCRLAKGYYDAFSIHPYTMETPPMDSDRYGAVLSARVAMDQSGADGIPLWLTEIGWPTNFHEYQEQAAWNVQFYAQMSRPELEIEKILYYDFMDDGSKKQYREDCFGVIESWNDRTPYLAKPAYLATSNMNYQLTDATLKKVSDREKDGLVMYQYEKPDGNNVLLVWGYPDDGEYTFSLGTDDAKVYDLYGTEEEVWSEDGKYTLVLDYRPKYIVGDFDKVEITDAIIGINNVSFNAPYDDTIRIELTRTKEMDLKVDVELPQNEYIEIIENIGFQGDRASVKIKTTGQAGQKDIINVLVSDQEGNLLRKIPVTLNYTEPIDFSFKTQPFNIGNFKRWIGMATIKNNNHDKAISGKIYFKSPAEFADKIGYIDIPDILPDKEKTITFNLPELKNFKSYFIDARIVLNNGYEKEVKFYSDCSAATYAEVKPVIDGVMSPGEWNDSMGLRLAEGDEYLDFTFGTGSYTGKDDLSADVFFEWDEDNFYMFAKVKDDVFMQEQTGDGIWLGDSIQIGITYAGAQKPNVQGFTEIGLGLTPDGEYLARYTNEVGATGQNKDSELKITQEDDYTNYELKMPWKELIVDNTEIKGNEQIRFNMIINENDGAGRYGWLEYSSGIGQLKDATVFGYLNLLDTRDMSKQIIKYDQTKLALAYGDIGEITVLKRLDDAAKIEISDQQNVKYKIAENNGFKDNKAVIKLQSLGNKGESDVVKLKVKDSSGNIISEQEIQLEYQDLADIEFSVNPLSMEGNSKQKAQITVTNNSSEQTIKGKIKITEPQYLAKAISEMNISDINPGESKALECDLPELDYSMYDIKAVLELDDGYKKEIDLNGNWLSASYAKTAPVIDGVMTEGEWDDTSCLKLRAKNFYEDLTFGGGTYTGNEDLSADIYMKWDENNFYMLAEVTDDVFNPKKSMFDIWSIDRTVTRVDSWEGDSIQFGITSNIKDLTDSSRFTEIGLALLKDEGAWITRYSNESGLSAETDKSQVMIKNEGNKTYYELVMPWKELVLNTDMVKEDGFLRFNIIVNENDGEGRYGWLEFSDGIGQSKNPAKFGWLKLQKE